MTQELKNKELNTYKNKKNSTINLVIIISIIILGVLAAFGFAGIYRSMFDIEISDVWYLLILIPIGILQYIGFRNNKLDLGTKVNEKKTIEYSTVFIKIVWLSLAILLMALAQATLAYTPHIGMAPIDSLTQAWAYAFKSEYSLLNYLIIFFLVFSTIMFAPPKNKVMASTSFITGYSLAYLVHFFVNYVLIHFPGLQLINGNGGTDSILIGIIYFLIGFGLLVTSIGIWVNVGIGLRPYDALLISLETKYKQSYVFFRNTLDTTWALLALIGTIIAIQFQGYTWTGQSSAMSLGIGTFLFIFGAGICSDWLRKLFSHIIK